MLVFMIISRFIFSHYLRCDCIIISSFVVSNLLRFFLIHIDVNHYGDISITYIQSLSSFN